MLSYVIFNFENFPKSPPIIPPATPLAPPPPHIFSHGGANFFLDGGAMGGRPIWMGGRRFCAPPLAPP